MSEAVLEAAIVDISHGKLLLGETEILSEGGTNWKLALNSSAVNHLFPEPDCAGG